MLKGGREYQEGKEIAISNLRFDMEEEGDEDRRREAAIAATPVLQPNFQAESVSHEQLQKLKELRRRRLQIKKTTSSFKKMKGKTTADKTTKASEVITKDDITQKDPESIVPEESYHYVKNVDVHKTSKEQNVPLPWKRRQKLHWGLDTRERWERKGNM
jgi:hypothetical protein